MRTWACITVLFLAAAARPVVAQRSEPPQAAVPRDLVVGLLRMQYAPFTAEPGLLIGRMPDAMAGRIRLPPGATVLGSVTWPEMSVVLVRSPLAPDSARAEVGRLLVASGWQEFRPPGRQGGGFVPSMAMQIPSMYCRADTSVTMTVLPQTTAGSEVRLAESVGRMSACDSERRMRAETAVAYAGGRGRPPMPTLRDPPGSGPPVACFQGRSGGMSMSTGTTVRTSLTPEAILAHYAKQLESEGWKSTTAGSAAAAGTWTRTDSTGRAIETTLRVTTNPRIPECREVSMEVRGSP